MNDKKKVYLAGAMGCYATKEEANDWRKYIVKSIFDYCSMTDKKCECFNPCDFYGFWSEQQHYTEKEVMRYDLGILKNCDLVIVNLKDLDKSLGTSDEILYAYLHGIPVIGFCEGKEIVLHPWKNEQINRIETGDNAINKAIKYICEYYL